MCSFKTEVGPAAPGKTIFSLSELKKLLKQDNACVSCVTCQRSMDITPLHLGDLKTSIRNLLDEKVTKYDVELQGVILAHKNVKIVAESVVLSDSRSFPLEYVADIYVFKPKIGSKLIGVVNKIPMNREYVSVLVHNIFNVVVYAAHRQPKPAVKMGSSVNVTVTYIDFTGRLPFIKAEISFEDFRVQEEADILGETSSPKPLLQTPRKGLTSILKNSPARLRQSSTEVETESSCAENGTVIQAANTSRVGEKDTREKKKKKKKDREGPDEKGTEKSSKKENVRMVKMTNLRVLRRRRRRENTVTGAETTNHSRKEMYR
uniref:DNA-directed RNA polymerase I subunit RPA43 n=1 Tax=Lygus hesperus TaxID=30085 RepID=A0A0A9ZD88_LYGHE